MTIQRYKLKNIRLKSNVEVESASIHNIVTELYRWGISDFTCFKIINEFFFTIADNNETKEVISQRLNTLKDEQELIFNNTANRYSFYKLKELILNLFENSNISYYDYRKIYSCYLEYLTLQWRKTPGKYGKVVYEPLIKYKRRELFGGKDFSNSKCDVVYKNNKTKTLFVYECKFRLRTFFHHLRIDINNETGRTRRMGMQAQRKINYLRECNTVFSSHFDVENLDVKIVTLATESVINSSLHLLGGVEVITREKIESPSSYSLLN